MPRPCSICRLPHLRRVDTALLAGGTVSEVAKEFGLSDDALQRHFNNHLAPGRARGKRARDLQPAPISPAARAQPGLDDLTRWSTRRLAAANLTLLDEVKSRALERDQDPLLLKTIEVQHAVHAKVGPLFDDIEGDAVDEETMHARAVLAALARAAQDPELRPLALRVLAEVQDAV